MLQQIIFQPQITFGDLFVVFGWILTFFYTMYQIKKTYESNVKAQNLLFKQEIEYKAYSRIQDTLDQYSSSLSQFNGYLINLVIHLSLLEGGKNLRKDWANIPYELIQENSKQTDRFIEFMRTYDSNEIIILEFKSFKDELAIENNSLAKNFEKFHTLYLGKIHDSTAVPNNFGIPELRDEIRKISEKIIHIDGYIYDFRIEMQNKILGQIFDKKVQKRQPGDVSVKILSLNKKD